MTTPPTDARKLAEEAWAQSLLPCFGLNHHNTALEQLARAVIDLSAENERLRHNITVWADTLRDVKREAHKVIDDLSDKLDEAGKVITDHATDGPLGKPEGCSVCRALLAKLKGER